ncbi:hypothetical protein I5D01_04200 [Staphylococcus aureus]|nr:hypothetical protein I5D01_04200 [Staphylococcus aureus]
MIEIRSKFLEKEAELRRKKPHLFNVPQKPT